MTIIGLAGFARSGKDSVADILVEHHGFTRIAFADKLRELALWINPELGPRRMRLDDVLRLSMLDDPEMDLLDPLDRRAWEAAKLSTLGPHIRVFLQQLGERARRVLGGDVWVDAAMRDLDPAGLYVIPDVRYPNEVDRVLATCGNSLMWRVIRPGVGAANDHVSENALHDRVFDASVLNDGSLDDLRREVADVYGAACTAYTAATHLEDS